MTHDSIGLGEDGPTHQPIEQLSGLRSIPNLNIFRPADRIETIESMKFRQEITTYGLLNCLEQHHFSETLACSSICRASRQMERLPRVASHGPFVALGDRRFVCPRGSGSSICRASRQMERLPRVAARGPFASAIVRLGESRIRSVSKLV